MLLSSEMVAKVFRLQVTEARRPCTPRRGISPRAPYTIGQPIRLHRYLNGGELTEQERSRIRNGDARPFQKVGDLRVTDLRQQRLGDMSDDDLRRQGFASIGDWAIHWVLRWDRLWAAGTDDPAANALARYSAYWAERESWVIVFELASTTMLLAQTPLAAGDYVDQAFDRHGKPVALMGEGEAVHPQLVASWAGDPTSTHALIQARRAAAGEMTSADWREVNRHLAGIEARVSAAKARARRAGIDISQQIKAYRRAQERNRTAAHLETLLEAIEHHVEPKEGGRAA